MRRARRVRRRARLDAARWRSTRRRRSRTGRSRRSALASRARVAVDDGGAARVPSPAPSASVRRGDLPGAASNSSSVSSTHATCVSSSHCGGAVLSFGAVRDHVARAPSATAAVMHLARRRWRGRPTPPAPPTARSAARRCCAAGVASRRTAGCASRSRRPRSTGEQLVLGRGHVLEHDGRPACPVGVAHARAERRPACRRSCRGCRRRRRRCRTGRSPSTGHDSARARRRRRSRRRRRRTVSHAAVSARLAVEQRHRGAVRGRRPWRMLLWPSARRRRQRDLVGARQRRREREAWRREPVEPSGAPGVMVTAHAKLSARPMLNRTTASRRSWMRSPTTASWQVAIAMIAGESCRRPAAAAVVASAGRRSFLQPATATAIA